MKFRFRREGNPFAGGIGEPDFEDLEDYAVAAAKGAKLEYMMGANTPCLIRLLYKNAEIAYHFDSLYRFKSTQFSCKQSDIEWLLSQIHSTNDTLFAFVVTYVSYHPDDGKTLHVFAVGDKSEQVLHITTFLDKHDPIHITDTDFSLLKEVFNPLLEELNNKHYREYTIKKKKQIEVKKKQREIDIVALADKRKSRNQCQYCGGDFKGFFRKKCCKCGSLKDY